MGVRGNSKFSCFYITFVHVLYLFTFVFIALFRMVCNSRVFRRCPRSLSHLVFVGVLVLFFLPNVLLHGVFHNSLSASYGLTHLVFSHRAPYAE